MCLVIERMILTNVRKYGLDSLKDYNDFSFCMKKSEFAKEVL